MVRSTFTFFSTNNNINKIPSPLWKRNKEKQEKAETRVEEGERVQDCEPVKGREDELGAKLVFYQYSRRKLAVKADRRHDRERERKTARQGQRQGETPAAGLL